MSNQQKVQAEIVKSPGSALELSKRTELTEKQVRNAIDSLREKHGKAVIVNRNGSFSMG